MCCTDRLAVRCTKKYHVQTTNETFSMPLANCRLLVGLRELKIVHSKIVDALFV